MPEPKNTLNRKEVKYVLDPVQARAVAEAVRRNLCAGEYGKSQVSSIYLDTARYDAIARSVEKPVYKEKLRIRWYGAFALADAPVAFVELKKKLKGVVYKRRLAVTPKVAVAFASGAADAKMLAECGRLDAYGAQGREGVEMPGLSETPAPARIEGPHRVADGAFLRNQLASELMAAFGRIQAKGPVTPSVRIECMRTAFGRDGEGGLRVTFDEGVRALDLRGGGCTPLLAEGSAVMEVKCDGYPHWLVCALDEACAYPRSFSKYGEFYEGRIASNA